MSKPHRSSIVYVSVPESTSGSEMMSRSSAINLEFTYAFTETRPWNIYAGGGPAINWYNFEDDSEAEAGFNFLVGAKSRTGLFFEMKIGVMDSPDLKFGVGYTFR